MSRCIHILPTKGNLPRIAFHDSLILLSRARGMREGVGVALHVTRITISKICPTKWRTCARLKTARRRLKCRVCLSLGSGKCDHMAASSRPPSSMQPFYPTADKRVFAAIFSWGGQKKKTILNTPFHKVSG